MVYFLEFHRSSQNFILIEQYIKSVTYFWYISQEHKVDKHFRNVFMDFCKCFI